MAGGVALVVALVLLASIALVVTHRQERLDEVARTAHDQANVTRNLIESVSVPEAEAVARDLAGQPALVSVMNGQPTGAALTTLLSTTAAPVGMTLYVVGRDGSSLASLPASAKRWSSPGSVASVAHAVAGRADTAASPAVPGTSLAEVAAVPIRSGGTLLGAVVAVMPLEAQLQRFVHAVGDPVVLVPGTDGSRATLVGASAPGSGVGAAVGDRLRGGPGEVSASASLSGDEVDLDLVQLDATGSGYVGVAVPTPGFFTTEGTTLFTVALLALLAGTLTSTAVLLFVDRLVRRPVADLERGVARVAAEDYEVDIPIRSDDELGRLAGAFNQMASRIGEEMEKTRSALVQLGWVSEALTTAGGGERGAPGAIVRAAAAIAGQGSSACLLMSRAGLARDSVLGDPGDIEAERAAAEEGAGGITERQGDDGRWWTSFPLSADVETTVGRLVVVTTTPVEENERRVLTTLANNAAIALEHTRLLEQEQDTARRLRAADRTRTEFLRTTHHELRTPLTVVLGMTDLAEESWETVGDEQRRDYMTTIAAGARQLAYTIEAILAVTTLSADEVALHRRSVALRELAEGCVDEAVHRQGLESARTTDVDVPYGLVIDADPVRFRQMLDALVDNALKFTRANGTVLVRARQIAGEVVLQVVDDGVGIPEEARPRVFDQFYQVESGHVREFGGLGVGLTIAARVCALHHASIELKSTRGEGTEVVVRWPAGEPVDAPVDTVAATGRQ